MKRLPVGLSLCLAAFCVVPGAKAAEQVSLRNGFDFVVDHRVEVGDKTRLFLRPNAALSSEDKDSFVEVATADILSIEVVTLPIESAASAPVASSPAASAPIASSPVAAELAEAKDAPLTRAELHELLTAAGTARNLDVDLLDCVVHAESGGRAHAVSRAGAQGLMQLMPKTAAELGVSDSFAPGQNINGGTAYLNALLVRYHDNLALALAAYNAGPGAVDKYHGVPPYRETRLYVARIIHAFNQRKAAQAKARRTPLSNERAATAPETSRTLE
jgi:soluble lytic murein transglycosylase-like protein